MKTKITPIQWILLILAAIVVIKYGTFGTQAVIFTSLQTTPKNYCAANAPTYDNYYVFSGLPKIGSNIVNYCFDNSIENCARPDTSGIRVDLEYLGTCYTIRNNLPPTTPVTIGQVTLTASSSTVGHGAEKVLDGSLATDSYWQPIINTVAGQWIKLEFASAKTIDSMTVTCASNCQNAAGAIQYYNTATSKWVTISVSSITTIDGDNHRNNPPLFTGMQANFAPVTTTKMRWLGTNGADGTYSALINEINIPGVTIPQITKLQTFSVTMSAENIGAQTLLGEEKTASVVVSLKNV